MSKTLCYSHFTASYKKRVTMSKTFVLAKILQYPVSMVQEFARVIRFDSSVIQGSGIKTWYGYGAGQYNKSTLTISSQLALVKITTTAHTSPANQQDQPSHEKLNNSTTNYHERVPYYRAFAGIFPRLPPTLAKTIFQPNLLHSPSILQAHLYGIPTNR